MKDKVILFTAILLLNFWGGISFAQEQKRTFESVDYVGFEEVSPYLEAWAGKDIDAYRLVSSGSLIRFDPGFEIELYSAERLENEYGRYRHERFIQRMGNETIYPFFGLWDQTGKSMTKEPPALWVMMKN